MPDWAKELLGYGPLGAFAIAVCWALWLAIRHGAPKAYELGERYVVSTERLHDSLKESTEKQQKLCDQHGDRITDHDERSKAVALKSVELVREYLKQCHPEFVMVDQKCDAIEKLIKDEKVA